MLKFVSAKVGNKKIPSKCFCNFFAERFLFYAFSFSFVFQKVSGAVLIHYIYVLAREEAYGKKGKMVSSRAVVLNAFKYNDSYNIVDVYTVAEGRVSFLVRLPRTSKARVRPVLFQPLSLLEVEWNARRQASLQRLTGVRAYAPYSTIPYDPVKTTMALFLAEFLTYALKGDRGDSALFEYVEKSLMWLDEARQGVANFHLVFLMRMSQFLGFYPNVEGYVPGSVFNLESGCFSGVAPLHGHFVPAQEAALLPLLLRMRYGTLHLFTFSHAERDRLLDVINDYYALHLPSFPRLKSLDVLRAVFSAS